ncbi:cache domain-containing protein, partial [Nitrospira defluvii]|nr:cache domain-containing protein [Nitrospira defluvii]
MKTRLRRKLIFTILVVGVLSVSIGLIATAWRGTDSLRKTIGDNFEGLANETAQKVDIVIAREVVELHHVSRAEVIVAALVESNHRFDGMSEDKIGQEIRRTEEAWRKSDHLLRAKQLSAKASTFLETAKKIGKKEKIQFASFVTDRRGILVASTSPEFPYRYQQASWWKKTIQMGRDDVFLSNIYQDEQSNQFVFDLAVPIFDDVSSEAIGVLRTIFHLKSFLTPLIEKTRFGETGHAMLIDSEGTVLACPILPTGMHIPDEILIASVTSLNSGWILAEDD